MYKHYAYFLLQVRNGLSPFQNCTILNEKSLSLLDEYLQCNSYICDYVPTTADAELFNIINKHEKLNCIKNRVHVERWYQHINSFSSTEKQKFISYKPDSIKPLVNSLLDIQVINFLFFYC